MPSESQVRLLRALETGTITRVGGERPVEVDIRLIAATNREVQHEVQEGRLHEDLRWGGRLRR